MHNRIFNLSVGTLEWDQLSDKPGTSSYAAARGGRFDEVHVVVIDDKGEITGNAGTILEKHLNLSKGKDAEYSVGSTAYWRKYLATNSKYIYGGSGAGFAGITTTSFGTSSTNTLMLILVGIKMLKTLPLLVLEIKVQHLVLELLQLNES